MTTTNGTGLVKLKELLIQTNIAVEDLLDVAANFYFVSRGEWTNKPTNLSEGAKFAH
jgi:hypothetical protein